MGVLAAGWLGYLVFIGVSIGIVAFVAKAIGGKRLSGVPRVPSMKLKVLVHPAEEGGYWAEVPALAGCVSEGETLDEVLANIREAAEGWMEVAAERTSSDTDAQIVEVEL